MTARLKRLRQILLIKEKATMEAAGAWANARQQYSANKQRHDQLINYRGDYVTQLNNIGNTGCTIGRLRNRLEFISQLDVALGQVSQQLGQLAKQRAYFEKIYLNKKMEQDAVERLIERVEALQQARVERTEQKESDEYAQKQWYSKNKTSKTENHSE